MFVLLFLLVLLAIAGLLGAFLKAVLVIVVATVLATAILGWLGWRALQRQLARADWEVTAGTTDVRVGKIRRTPPDREPPAIDDRY
jgi:hypothetical protein